MNTDQRNVSRLDVSSVESIRPHRDHVLVKLEPPPEQTTMGILIPAAARQRDHRTAIVVAAGPEADEVGPGFRVLLGPDPGWELPDGHRVLRVGAVLAVLE